MALLCRTFITSVLCVLIYLICFYMQSTMNVCSHNLASQALYSWFEVTWFACISICVLALWNEPLSCHPSLLCPSLLWAQLPKLILFTWTHHLQVTFAFYKQLFPVALRLLNLFIHSIDVDIDVKLCVCLIFSLCCNHFTLMLYYRQHLCVAPTLKHVHCQWHWIFAPCWHSKCSP